MQSYVVWPLSDVPDVESLVLEEAPKPSPRPPADVPQAWNQEAQQQLWLFIVTVSWFKYTNLNFMFTVYLS